MTASHSFIATFAPHSSCISVLSWKRWSIKTRSCFCRTCQQQNGPKETWTCCCRRALNLKVCITIIRTWLVQVRWLPVKTFDACLPGTLHISLTSTVNQQNINKNVPIEALMGSKGFQGVWRSSKGFPGVQTTRSPMRPTRAWATKARARAGGA